MRTVTNGGDSKHDRRASKVAQFTLGVYQQVAAAFAAFGLAALIGHFWDIGWRGILATLIGVWDDTVRPVATWVLRALVSWPLSLAGIEFEVPLLMRDYLAVGVVFLASVMRAWRALPDGLSSTNSRMGDVLAYFQTEGMRETAGIVLKAWPFILPFWPLLFVLILLYVGVWLWNPSNPTKMEAHASLRRRELRRYSLMLSPLLYLAILLGLNYLVL